MKISVITIARNEAAQIGRCFGSVERQTYADIEHIIVDGRSTDDTPILARDYCSRHSCHAQLIESEPRGVYAAINEGISRASGDIICLLHANDSFASDDVLARVAEAFRSNPDVEIVYGDIYYVDAKGGRGRIYSARRFTPDALLDGFAFPHPAMFVRRARYDATGLYDTRYRLAGDFDWIVRAVLKDKAPCLYLPLDMVAMSTGGLSTRLVNRLWYNAKEKLRVLRSHGYKVSALRMLKRYFYY